MKIFNIAIFTETSDVRRQWPLQSWHEIMSQISRVYPINWTVCGNFDFPKEAYISVKERFKKIDDLLLIEVIRSQDLIITNDSAPAHIARFIGIPRLVVAGGGTWPRFAIESKMECWSISYMNCFGCNWYCKFPYSHGRYKCVDNVEPKDVICKAKVLIDGL